MTESRSEGWYALTKSTDAVLLGPYNNRHAEASADAYDYGHTHAAYWDGEAWSDWEPVDHYHSPRIARESKHHQTRIDSFMEAVTNTAIGFLVSLLTWIVVARIYGIPMTWATNLSITAIFTIVSIVRQYILRRLFNGRSVWAALRDRIDRLTEST